MQAPASIRFHKVLVGFLVMPWFVAGAAFHGRKNMHKARMVATLGQNLLDEFFLAILLGLAYELNLHAIGFCNSLSIGSYLVT